MSDTSISNRTFKPMTEKQAEVLASPVIAGIVCQMGQGQDAPGAIVYSNRHELEPEVVDRVVSVFRSRGQEIVYAPTAEGGCTITLA